MKKASRNPKKIDKLFDQFYQKYGKPLEKEHWGDFLAVSPDGEILLGKDVNKVAKEAHVSFGPGVFLYKIGEKAIGKWLRIH